MPEKFVIYGGKPLKGEVEIKGAKNAAFPILAAALLTRETCILDNLPLIEDVFQFLRVLEILGAKISWLEKRRIRINCSEINPLKIPPEIVCRFRGSVLLIGPFLARFNKVKIPPPGGCLIGARPIDTHLDAFSQAGIKVSILSPDKENNKEKKDNLYFFEKKQQEGKEVILREFSVTATENLLLFFASKPQKTILKIADLDYQVQELIRVLKKMGVEVREIGAHTIEIRGTKNPRGFQHKLISDPIETGTFIVATLATGGDVLIKNAELSFLTLFLKRLKDFGASFRIINKDAIRVLPSGYRGSGQGVKNLKMDKIQSLPYPGIHSDLQPELGVLATQTEGPTLIHDPLFEGRLKYLEELNKMGANIIFCDPHRAVVYGPSKLQGIEISSLDLRAGAALIIAGLTAEGKTVINNIYQIDRGYERIEERLQQLGADIRRVKE
ncbi:MAG: UDP-N-acetylglucosamine 1-carboxyvinyltransferase [Candidatus Nealsonbacteria bacterium]|nr:UDP-N-acetylglucosamine 1-carboxyvinyltransferase [Candidatus Nealsonbacteria bacterium]